MAENRKFRTRIDDYIDGTQDNTEEKIHIKDTNLNLKTYPSINFVWLDGHEHAFSYSYMAGVSFDMEDKNNVITANFTAYNVTIKGYKLYPIYEGLMSHTINHVAQSDSNYASLANPDEPVVSEIVVA
jgi:hypothetical protein